jgi:hypothetical protein
MDENHPLDIFLQPSKRLIALSLFFVISCALLLVFIPLSQSYKALLFLIMFVGILMELRLKILLTSSRSIIRLGCDGGVVDRRGNVSELCWWYQRRSGGDKVKQRTTKSRLGTRGQRMYARRLASAERFCNMLSKSSCSSSSDYSDTSSC